MTFPFDDRKTVQTAAYLLKLSGGRMNYMVLIKLMYLADRRMLRKHGRPITGDAMVSMPHGPALSTVYDLVRRRFGREPTAWNDYVSEPNNFEVSLIKEASLDDLSPYEVSILDAVFKKYGGVDVWDLRDWLHRNIPEWKDPSGSSLPINPEDILRLPGGWEEDRIEDAKKSAAEANFFASLAR